MVYNLQSPFLQDPTLSCPVASSGSTRTPYSCFLSMPSLTQTFHCEPDLKDDCELRSGWGWSGTERWARSTRIFLWGYGKGKLGIRMHSSLSWCVVHRNLVFPHPEAREAKGIFSNTKLWNWNLYLVHQLFPFLQIFPPFSDLTHF